MITYEVRIKINQNIENEWLEWMKTVHVPEVIATGMVRSFQILKPQEGEAQRYHFHYHFESQSDYELYIQNHTAKLRESVLEKYDGQFEASRQIYTWI